MVGLDAGANNDLIRPFEMAEPAARGQALLPRRVVPQQWVKWLDPLCYDAALRQVFAAEAKVDPHWRGLSIFECWLIAKGQLVSTTNRSEYAFIWPRTSKKPRRKLVARLRRRPRARPPCRYDGAG